MGVDLVEYRQEGAKRPHELWVWIWFVEFVLEPVCVGVESVLESM